jgi:LacI family transcriptional regulator
MARPTIADIAREAGVSTATVDRVLNGRPGVKGRTHDLVRSTAARLRYPGGGAEAFAAEGRRAVEIVLPGGTNAFMDMLAAAFEAEGSGRTDLAVRVRRIEGFNPDALAEAIGDVRDRCDGLGIVALDHPTVREAIRGAAATGVPVVTLCSDISHVPRRAYVGIDNRAAGRLAGYLVGRFVGRAAGRVALFAGSLSYRGHEEREMGFRHILAESFPSLEIVALREVRDDVERSYAEARALLAAQPDIAGLYNIGAGNRGIARALAEAGRAGRTVYVGHELTEHTRRFLLQGTMDAVIDQMPAEEARLALAALAGAPTPPAPLPARVVFRENLPDL